jgi:hypothetical protein
MRSTSSSVAPARPRLVPGRGVVLIAVALLGAAVAIALGALDVFAPRPPALVPRHRAEALCFALAAPPRFDPPMSVQPSAALVRGRFGVGIPATYAIQDLMGFAEEHVLKQWTQHVGDYDVTMHWLRLPGSENEHWLVVAWMEGADLAVCNFRFTGTSRVLTAEERAWGERLLRRVLVPENFHRDALPAATLEVSDSRTTMPVFGPASN